MAKKVVDKLLPTTMVGSYPRPQWFKHQLLGRDIRVAFKEVHTKRRTTTPWRRSFASRKQRASTS